MISNQLASAGETEINAAVIAKHRNGPIDTITLFFEKHFTKFTSLERIAE